MSSSRARNADVSASLQRAPSCARASPRYYFRFSYAGHYIVLCGYDGARGRGMLQYRDPGSSTVESYTSIADFDRARRSHGTDEDLLIIRADNRPPTGGAC